MNKIEEALQQLKNGGLVIVADADDREAEGDLIGIAELVTAENVNFMTKNARGLICAPISSEIAEKLSLRDMLIDNTDAFGTAFTASVDHQRTSTGISTFDRAETIKELANPLSKPSDFYRPGHIFPLIAKDDGVLERTGHTEAAVDLAMLAGSIPAAYICEILNEDGTMARQPQLRAFAQQWHLPMITIEELIAYRKEQALITVDLPTEYGDFKLTLFENNHEEHLVLSMGEVHQSHQPILVRLHSECLTGDIFHSKRCDCGKQLQASMAMIAKAGTGMIIYLRQEGRGIGLRNKLKAYQLQEKGLDTYDANVKLGFPPDLRDYTFAAEILQRFGIDKIRLLTNNPDKMEELKEAGIEIVERIPIEVTPVKENLAYLQTKKRKFHHYLSV